MKEVHMQIKKKLKKTTQRIKQKIAEIDMKKTQPNIPINKTLYCLPPPPPAKQRNALHQKCMSFSLTPSIFPQRNRTQIASPAAAALTGTADTDATARSPACKHKHAKVKQSAFISTWVWVWGRAYVRMGVDGWVSE